MINREEFLNKRYKSEKRFQFYGKSAIVLALLFLAVFLFKIFSTGYTAFQKTWITIPINYDPEFMYLDADQKPSIQDLEDSEYFDVGIESFAALDQNANEDQITDIKRMFAFIFEEEIKYHILSNPDDFGKIVEVKLTASDDLDQVFKGNYPRELPEERRRVTDYQLKIFDKLNAEGKVESNFNFSFFTNADSREAELAGIASSFMGSLFSILVCLAVSFPVALLAAIYLEEFAPKNRLTDFIEVNINNLAAVPSIIFGLLGLAIFLNVMHLPRSAPIVGGMVLALMTLPTIIIATRASLKAVPPSIREAAIGLGATKFQTVTHHVLPLSLPGILTGTIIGMSQALGESAPLLMIGMVAFIVDVPGSFLDSSTVLPVQIYLWKSTAARGFVELTAAGVMVLLSFLILMNGLAVYIRQKFEKKW